MIKVPSLLILYRSLSELNLKHYIPLILNIKRRAAFIFDEPTLVQNTSQTASHIKRTNDQLGIEQ